MSRGVVFFSRAICLLGLSFWLAPAAQGEELSGQVQVIDAGRLMLQGREIRLGGIMTPGLTQTCRTKHGKPYHCGEIAAKALGSLTKGQRVTCDDSAAMLEGVGRCWVGRMDLAEQLVLQGWALADPGADPGANSGADPTVGESYKRAERGAKMTRQGMWKGRFKGALPYYDSAQ